MKTNLTKAFTIRIDQELYEMIETMKWATHTKQSELLRELVQIGLEAKINQCLREQGAISETEVMR